MVKKHVLVTGGAGYCGSVLVPMLLQDGYRVTVFDTLYYGSSHLPLDDENLEIVKGDIRDQSKFAQTVTGKDFVLHLACISNDASFELDEQLSTTVNFQAFEPLVQASKSAGVKRFVYASSSSVYGISSVKDVTEEHPLVPLTLYNKYKGMCEPILLKYADDQFETVIFRPATVCGFGPRQRLDLTVNILTNLAINNKKITVFGGEQLRPNLHIADYADLCRLLLTAPKEKVQKEIFNCGFENMSVMEIALNVKEVVEEFFPDIGDIDIVRTETDDNRSYHINSDKIFQRLGFRPQRSVRDAIGDLCKAFQENRLPDPLDDISYFNVKTMKALGVK